MQLGMIGLGRMGGNMVRRLMRRGHECVVFDASPSAVQELSREGAFSSLSLADLAIRLEKPRVIWLMIPAAAVDEAISGVLPHLEPGDVLIDGGNSYYVDDIRRARELSSRGIHYVDVGTSGGVWGLERGYCMTIGGETAPVQRLEPIFASLAPGRGHIERTPGRSRLADSTAEEGYLHCGQSGAGHFVKMVQNGIEYGLMASYAEGFDILRAANADRDHNEVDAGLTPRRERTHFDFDIDLAEVAEVWRRGSVVASWLLDLAAAVLNADPKLAAFAERGSDSGEGRWTVKAAVDEGVPAPVLSAALYQRFSSRGGPLFQDKLLSALRNQFGGHAEESGG